MDFHKEDERFRYNKLSDIYYYIVLVGCGGTGGYAVQRITKMLAAFQKDSFLMIADPDIIEEKNLIRQPFIRQDISCKKAEIMAGRYGSTYGLRIGSYTDKYVESKEEIENLFSLTDYRHKSGHHIQKVLIGAVDNDFSRKVMHDYFKNTDDLIYIDAGIEGVYVPEGESWSQKDREESSESGYSGQVVVGMKKNGKEILAPLDSIYPIDDNDLIPPSHNCGLEPYQPQRMIANEFAAFHISTILNELFSNHSIQVHYANFNARTGACRPVYVGT
ncbi:ThiF family adenylyltransferase [Paenibacillus sp. UMB7766-LJ446]|uniref:ThiF family adenylyltransferase n=1 Tax=Paenibacillus sp. UMB7766-LJ446 TaxID=3046313 RepID=UPI00254AB967|nr:ThiF family adenylyltransferase [Paenibacillus sp. UMB7766-LJ446]MDK8193050.1 ThiF family adenylyltransferase [Paenibacillus sp. UMB7766-LJ446]